MPGARLATDPFLRRSPADRRPALAPPLVTRLRGLLVRPVPEIGDALLLWTREIAEGPTESIAPNPGVPWRYGTPKRPEIRSVDAVRLLEPGFLTRAARRSQPVVTGPFPGVAPASRPAAASVAIWIRER
jgi:hypothetical protein